MASVVSNSINSRSYDVCLIERKNNREIPAHINLSQTASGTIYCEVQSERKVIGTMRLHNSGRDIHVATLNNNCDGQIGHVGKALLDVAVQVSRDAGYEGRISTLATKSSHVFYYRCGLRPNGFDAEKVIAKIKQAIQTSSIQTKRADTFHIGPVTMANY